MRDTHREAETQAGGEAGSMQGARCGTRSRDSRITPWAEGRRQTAQPPRDPPLCTILVIDLSLKLFQNLKLFFLRFYLFIHERQREREREAETQAEGEAGSMQGARCGTRSQDSRITPWTEGRCLTTEPPRHPNYVKYFYSKTEQYSEFP